MLTQCDSHKSGIMGWLSKAPQVLITPRGNGRITGGFDMGKTTSVLSEPKRVCIDATLPIHERIVGLSDKAFRALVELGCYVSRGATDGRIPKIRLHQHTTLKVRLELQESGIIVKSENDIWTFAEWGSAVRPADHKAQYIKGKRRLAIPRKIREFVMARDGYQCQICKATENLALDHIYPWSLGGSDTPDNLQVLCRTCNSRKGNSIE